jgi:NAD(P)-dependent dehydrogenase (short-subunit alcohol dehydrogenase family)
MESGEGRKLALVKGASSGIGFELARVFAEEGFDLLIAAEDGELSGAQQQPARTLDLPTRNRLRFAIGEPETVSAGTGRPWAGVEVHAHRVDLAEEAGVVELYRHVLNVGRPLDALALRNELKETGIAVTSLMPGPTETEFFARAEMEDTEVGASEKDDLAEVARQGFDALMAGKEKVVAGALKNKAQVAAGRVIPDRLKAEKHRDMAEPGSAKED